MAVALFCVQRQGKHRVPRVFRDRKNLLDTLSDKEIIGRYRLDRESIYDICQALDALKRATRRSNALPVSLQVLAALRFYATGSFQSVIGDGHTLSKMSVSRSIRDVSNCLSSMVQHYISYPANVMEQMLITQNFYDLGKFPNVLGAVDGTHIPIIAPRIDEHVYVCRKGYHSINVQGIMDAKMKFLNIVAKWPGSTHDSFIWNNSEILPTFESGDITGGWLLGDSAYPCQPWLMTPKLHPTSEPERRYNTAHKTTRNVIERGFGLWKMRFRCLHKSGGNLMFTPGRCVRVIISTAVLLNICVSKTSLFPLNI